MDLSSGIINTAPNFAADDSGASGVDIHDLEMTPEKIASARSYGYSDKDIVSYLSQNSAVPVTDARKAGYSDRQIVDYLAKPPAPEPTPDEPSAATTALHAGERGVLPAAGGWAGMAAGAKLGAIVGAAIPVLGETGVGEAGGAIVGGLIGGFAGSAVADKAQQAVLDVMPDDVLQKIGQSTSQQQAEELAHPYVAMVAELSPNLFLLRPGFGAHVAREGAGTLERALASPIGSRAVGAGLMGTQEAASEAVQNGDVDPAKVAIAAGAGALMNKETGLGRVVRGAGEGIVPNIGPYRDSAVATANDVMSAPDIDAAIEAADTASSTAAPDTTEIAAGAKLLDDHVVAAQQEKLNSLFKGLNSGELEKAADDTYVFRTTDEDGKEVSAPIKVWNPDTDEVAPGENAITPELAKVQTDHYGQMGIDVVYLHGGPNIPFDGAVDPRQPDTIFLSSDPDRNAAQVGGHEVAHVLENTTLPDGTNLGDLLHQQVRDGLTQIGREDAEDRFGVTAPKRDAFPAGPDGDEAHADAVTLHLVKELSADIGGEAPKFDIFIPKVIDAVQQRYGASVAQDVLAKFLAGIKSAMETLRKFFGADQNNTESQNWVSNLSEVHDTLARMQAERYGSALERQQAADAGATDLTARDLFLKTGELPEKAPAEPVTGETGASPAGEPGPEPSSPTEVPAGGKKTDLAPQVTPDLGLGYSDARTKALTYRRWLGDLDEQRRAAAVTAPETVLLQKTAAAILDKVGGVEDRLTKTAATRLDQIRQEVRTRLNPVGDSPDMARVRAAMVAEHAKMADAAAVTKEIAPTAPKEEATATFNTSRGSTYIVHEDGTTTRDKAARNDPGHEGQSGLQPRSEATFYVTPEQADALSLFQTIGPKKELARRQDGSWGIKYTEGKDAGKFERRTIITPQTEPAAGLTPVEIFKGGRSVHFGNEIVEVAKTSPRVTPAMRDRMAARHAEREAKQEPTTVEREGVPAAEPAKPAAPAITEEKSAQTAPESPQRRLTMPNPEGKGGKIVRAANSEETQALVNADQQKRVSKAFDRDFDRSVEVAMRERQPPEGILPSFYFLEAERRATRDGNLDLIMKLKNSPVAEEVTTAGRTIQSFATRDPQSAVARISDVEAARRAAAESAATAQHGSLANAEAAAATKAGKEIRTAVKAQVRARKPDAWTAFIQSITCGVK